MAITVLIRNNGDGELVGPFVLQSKPSVHEMVTVPWAADPSGVRIFQIEEIAHIAQGATNEASEDCMAHSILSGFEIT
ncbi:hypothetical protein [Novosphingobium sp.]|uniref:hypothetical protein n=1 Tax=Novosphingobium sp. TaxID=1874826 RepID=UPI00286EAF15|nr:hypothetical protein [Novosphingobium sp.]